MGIGSLLEANKGLVTLNLSFNPMVLDVWGAVGYGLRHNATLTCLDLQWCELTPVLFADVRAALKVNNTCDVNINYNPLPLGLQFNIRAPRSSWTPNTGAKAAAGAARAVGTAGTAGGVNDGDDEVLKLSETNEMAALCSAFDWRQERLIEIASNKNAADVLHSLGMGKYHAHDFTEGATVDSSPFEKVASTHPSTSSTALVLPSPHWTSLCLLFPLLSSARISLCLSAVHLM